MFQFLTLKPELFALDISDLSLKIVKLKKARKTFRGQEFLSLSSFGRAKISSGIIESGEIKNEFALAEVIKKALNEVRGEKIKTKYVVVSLPEEKAFLQVIQMPKMSKEELEKAIRFEAANHIPLPLEDVYLDFQTIQPLDDYLDYVDVLIAAFPKKIADSYLSTMKQADLVPIVFETESQAISRALIKNEVSPFPVALVDIGETRTSFIVFSGYSLYFSSLISVSSQSFTAAIAKGLSISLPEAEKIKRKYGLEVRDKVYLGRSSKSEKYKREIIEDKKILNTIAPVVLDLVQQISKYINYYQTHGAAERSGADKKKIKKIILSGGGANLKGLPDVIASELQVSVETGNPWVNILPEPLREVPELSFEESLSYTTALGLAFRGAKGE